MQGSTAGSLARRWPRDISPTRSGRSDNQAFRPSLSLGAAHGPYAPLGGRRFSPPRAQDGVTLHRGSADPSGQGGLIARRPGCGWNGCVRDLRRKRRTAGRGHITAPRNPQISEKPLDGPDEQLLVQQRIGEPTNLDLLAVRGSRPATRVRRNPFSARPVLSVRRPLFLGLPLRSLWQWLASAASTHQMFWRNPAKGGPIRNPHGSAKPHYRTLAC